MVLFTVFFSPVVATGQDDIFDDDLTSDSSADAAGAADAGFGDTSGAGFGDTSGADSFGLLDDPAMSSQDPEAARAEYEEKLQQAQMLVAEQRWEEALTTLQGLATVGQDARVQVGLGICYTETGSPDLAITALSQALVSRGAAMIPGLTEVANIYLGRVYLEKNMYREAQQKLADARQINPQNPEAAMLYGKASVRLAMRPSGMGGDQSGQGQLAQAIETLTQAIEIKPDLGEAYLERGRALMQSRRTEYAMEDLLKAVQLLGPTSDASADLASVYSMRAAQEGQKQDGDVDKIVGDFRSALAAFESYLQGATFGRKVAPWEKVDPLTQSPEKVLLSLADLRMSLAEELDNDESAQFYHDAIANADQILNAPEPAPEDELRAYFIRGIGNRMLGELRPAIDEFSKANTAYQTIAGRPYTEAVLRRGICWFHLGEYDLALQDFESAKVTPANPYAFEPRAMFWAGLTHANQQEYRDAIFYYTRAISASPQYIYAYLNRGLAYLNMGRLDQALEDFDFVLQQDPNNEQANEFRAMTVANMP